MYFNAVVGDKDYTNLGIINQSQIDRYKKKIETYHKESTVLLDQIKEHWE